MVTIKVFHSHIEITPYKKGDSYEIEKQFSKWDSVYHTRIPIAFFIQDETLYLPRGCSVTFLENIFGVIPTIGGRSDPRDKCQPFKMTYKPRNGMQKNAISFLTGTGEYGYASRFSQLGLNAETGSGKTFMTVSAIAKLKTKAIIIVHRHTIAEQWKDTFKTKTNIDMKRVMLLTSSTVGKILNGDLDITDIDIFITLHQTLSSYAREHSWNSIREFFKTIRVGVKVIDEAHKFFENIFMIDNFSNCYKSIYLTATFGRGDEYERAIYKRAFSSLIRFGENEMERAGIRKHIILVICYFESCNEFGITPVLSNGYGFSSYKYIDYEMRDMSGALLRTVHKIIDETSKLKGKTLILSPKKSTVSYFAKDIEEYTGDEVGTIFSDNTEEENERAKIDYKYISSTEKSLGEGGDIPGLRCLINLTPIGNPILARQVSGRLREYSPTEDTYLFYPIDAKLPDCERLLKKILPSLKSKCKEIITLRM